MIKVTKKQQKKAMTQPMTQPAHPQIKSMPNPQINLIKNLLGGVSFPIDPIGCKAVSENC
jgi:hypothetical protein